MDAPRSGKDEPIAECLARLRLENNALPAAFRPTDAGWRRLEDRKARGIRGAAGSSL
jgi:hypothetical protein